MLFALQHSGPAESAGLPADSLHAIADTAPIACGHEDVEIHSLVRRDHAFELLWTVKSFSSFSKLPFGLVIHDDGSLREEEVELFGTHFPGCRVIRRAEADEAVRPLLAKHRGCLAYRSAAIPSSVLALKVFDFSFFARGSFLISLDADVLFFRRPDELIQHARNRQPFFLESYQNAHALGPDALAELQLGDVLEGAGTGLCGYPANLLDLELVDSVLRAVHAAASRGERVSTWGLEQTVFALLASRCPRRFVRLGRHYQTGRARMSPDTIGHHYVNGSRSRFYTEGLQRLRQRESGYAGERDGEGLVTHRRVS